MSQLTAEITTSGLEKQTSAVWEFYFRFRFLEDFTVIGVLFYSNFVQIGPRTAEI